MAEKKVTKVSSEIKRPDAITINDPKTGEFKYLLDFTRDSVEWAEKTQKFNINVFEDGISTTALFELFFYSFHAHHPGVRKAEAESVLKAIGGITPALIERLIDLYAYTAQTLVATEETLKNATLTVQL